MADRGNEVRRRGEAPERFAYRQALQGLMNFVDNELGNGLGQEGGGARGGLPDFTEWRIQRAKTLKTLDEFREKLDTVCVGANYGKAVGNSAEITGAVASMAGAVLSLAGLPVAQTVTNIGNLVHHSGTLIDGLSNVVEHLVSANYLGEIEAVLEKDKELSRPLAQWMDISRELDDNVRALFGVSLADAKFNTVMKVFHEFSKFSTSVKGFDATVNLMRQGRYSVYIGNDVGLEKLRQFFQHLSACPEFADRVRVTLSVLSASTGALQVARDGVQAYRSIVGLSGPVVPSLLGGLNPEVPTTGAVSAFCVLQAISVAISVMSLINAASIIRNGTSKYSDALKQLQRSLFWELRRTEDL